MTTSTNNTTWEEYLDKEYRSYFIDDICFDLDDAYLSLKAYIRDLLAQKEAETIQEMMNIVDFRAGIVAEPHNLQEATEFHGRHLREIGERMAYRLKEAKAAIEKVGDSK